MDDDKRIIDGIARLSEDHEPPRHWEARVLAACRLAKPSAAMIGFSSDLLAAGERICGGDPYYLHEALTYALIRHAAGMGEMNNDFLALASRAIKAARTRRTWRQRWQRWRVNRR